MIDALNNALQGLSFATKKVTEASNNIANLTTPGIGENVRLEEEAVNLTIAEIAFKANARTIEVVEELNDELLRLVDKKV